MLQICDECKSLTLRVISQPCACNLLAKVILWGDTGEVWKLAEQWTLIKIHILHMNDDDVIKLAPTWR